MGTGREGERMIKEFPKDRDAKQKFLLEQVARIGPILQASGGKSEELGTLAPEAVNVRAPATDSSALT